ATLLTHPLIVGEATVSKPGAPVEHRLLPYADRGRLSMSRFARARGAGKTTRIRIAESERGAGGLAEELWDDGYVEVIYFFFRHPDGQRSGVMTIATREPAGFRDEHEALLESTRPVIELLLLCLHSSR